MLARLALGAFGVVEALWPRRTVDFWMGVAVEDPTTVELRPWVYAVARIEGLLILLWVLARLGRD